MIPVEITNYQDRETGQHHCFPSVPDFRKLSTPLVRVSRSGSRSGKNSGLISADEVEISSRLPYTAPSRPRHAGGGENRWWHGAPSRKGDGRGLAMVATRAENMCVVCERDNINSRYANTSHRCSCLNINGEVPVIASRSAFKRLDELIIGVKIFKQNLPEIWRGFLMLHIRLIFVYRNMDLYYYLMFVKNFFQVSISFESHILFKNKIFVLLLII